jgi:Serine aminopeptidase, S33
MQRRDFIRLALGTATSGPLVGPVFAQQRAGKLLLIHGRGQQKLDADQLKRNWLRALNRGFASKGKALRTDVDVAFPYYGDVLDGFTTAANIPLTSEVQARGSQDDDFLRFQAEVADELRTRAGITDAQIDAEYGNDPEPRGPLNWKWVQAILRALDRNGHGMNQTAIEVFTRDVYLYSTRSGVRDAIDAIVTKKLTEEPTVVVGHSLGTVVAYSVLTRDTRAIKVPLLVTVGSPLGVRAVRDQFIPIQSPPSVKSWYNAYDARDVVALYPLDRSSFPVTPPIENYGKVKNHTDNKHGIDGYLDDPEVAGKIAPQLA